MKYLLTKDDFILKETNYFSTYEYEDENINVSITKIDFTEEEISFTNELINLYEKNYLKLHWRV